MFNFFLVPQGPLRVPLIPVHPSRPDGTHYPQTPRDDNDKDECTQKDKYKDKDARNSSVTVCGLQYPLAHVLCPLEDKDKLLKRPNICYISEKQVVSTYLSRTFPELLFKLLLALFCSAK